MKISREMFDGVICILVALCITSIVLVLGLSSCSPAKEEASLEIVEIESESVRSEVVSESDAASTEDETASNDGIRSGMAEMPAQWNDTWEAPSQGESLARDDVDVSAEIYLTETNTEEDVPGEEGSAFQLIEGVRATLTPYS